MENNLMTKCKKSIYNGTLDSISRIDILLTQCTSILEQKPQRDHELAGQTIYKFLRSAMDLALVIIYVSYL